MKMIDHYQVFLKDGSNLFEMSMSRKGKIRHVEYGGANLLSILVENRYAGTPYVRRLFRLIKEPERIDSAKVKFVTVIRANDYQPTALLYEVLPS